MTDSFNEKNLIKPRQICFIFFALTPVNKLIFMPASLAAVAAEGLWMPLAANFILDGLLIFIILLASERAGNKPLYSVFENTIGKPLTRVFFFILALVFLAKSFLPILEHKLYIENTIYEMIPDRVIFYTFFIVSTYACVKGVKIFGRVADFAVLFSVLGISIILALSVTSADYSNLLPIFKKPSYNFVNEVFRSFIWHGDCLYMLLFCGHFRPEKLYKTKIMASYFSGAVITIFFFVTFYGVYGAIAPSQDYALSAVSVFSIIVTNIGRFDFMGIFLMLFSQVFAMILPFFAATKASERVFSTEKSVVPAIVINAALFIGTALLGKKVFAVLNFEQGVYCYVFLAITVLFALSPLILKKENKDEIHEN